jgi:hypothetical protein
MITGTVRRLALALLCATGLFVGIWAVVFPRGFYEAFPGFGFAWVSPDGPYNEHLVRDVGALNLGTGILAGLALVRTASVSPFTVGLVTLAYNLPHFIYHLTKLALFGPIDQVAEMIALGAALSASLVLTASGTTAIRPTAGS